MPKRGEAAELPWVEEEFGPLVSRHPVDNARRRLIGGWATGVGLVLGIPGFFMLVDDAGSRRTAGFLIGIALCGLVAGPMYLTKAIRGGGREYFEVRRDGLIHATARSLAGWSWDRVRSVYIRRAPQDGGIAAYFGSQLWATVWLDDGTRLTFNGLAKGYHQLGEAIVVNSPNAGRRRVGKWRWLALTIASLGGLAALIGVIVANPDTTRVIHHSPTITEYVEVPGLSDTVLTLVIIGIAVSGILAIIGLLQFFQAKPGKEADRD